MRGRRERQDDIKKIQGPVRTCIACRKKGLASSFVRLVRKMDGEVIVDRNRSLPGRGAHICKNQRCFEIAVLSKVLVRGFKKEIVFDKKMLEAAVF